MKNNINRIFFITAGILMLLASQGCSSKENKDVANASQKFVLPDSLVKTLQLEPVTTMEYSNEIRLNAIVDYNEDKVINIYPMVSGIASGVKPALGDYVQVGQELAVLRSSDVTTYNNNLETAESNVAIAKKSRDATVSMYKSGLASQADSVNAEEQYAQAQSNYKAALRILQNNGGSKSGEYVVRAPISGFVVQRNINNGTAVRTDNGNNLFTISDLNTVWIMANVYESSIPYIHAGDSVDITTLSYPGKIFRGRVDKVMDVLDPNSRVMRVRIVMDNPGYLLKPNMFASVSISYSENKKYLAIPSGALVFDNNQNYILVYNSPSDIVMVPVQVNGTHGNMTYVSGDGVKEGQKVISYDALLIFQQMNS